MTHGVQTTTQTCARCQKALSIPVGAPELHPPKLRSSIGKPTCFNIYCPIYPLYGEEVGFAQEEHASRNPRTSPATNEEQSHVP